MNKRSAARLFTLATAAVALSLALLACLASSSPGAATATAVAVIPPADETPLSGPTSEAAGPTPSTALPATSRDFRVAVLEDTLSEPVRRDQAQAMVQEASQFLRELTPIGLEMMDYAEDGGGGSTQAMVERYVASHAAALPNGMVVFSFGDGGQAKQSGGYSFNTAAPPGFRNSFVSPIVGANQIYVAVVHYSHIYAPCGYGGSDTAHSATSVNGECNNQPGTACVQQNGYSMCSSAVGHLYMSTRTHFVASSIVHELLHPFAPGGDQDHYSTPECSSKLGYPPGFFDLQEAQYHNDLWPFVYENFIKSFQP